MILIQAISATQCFVPKIDPVKLVYVGCDDNMLGSMECQARQRILRAVTGFKRRK